MHSPPGGLPYLTPCGVASEQGAHSRHRSILRRFPVDGASDSLYRGQRDEVCSARAKHLGRALHLRRRIGARNRPRGHPGHAMGGVVSFNPVCRGCGRGDQRDAARTAQPTPGFRARGTRRRRSCGRLASGLAGRFRRRDSPDLPAHVPPQPQRARAISAGNGQAPPPAPVSLLRSGSRCRGDGGERRHSSPYFAPFSFVSTTSHGPRASTNITHASVPSQRAACFALPVKAK